MYTHKTLYPGDDLDDAYQVRTAVFVHEQGFSQEIEIDDIDPVAHHIVMYLQDTPVATGRLFPQKGESDQYVIGRVAVLKEYRGSTGSQLMALLEQEAKSLGAKTATLGAQEQAAIFYSKLGYQSYGELYMEEFCPHIHMKKQL